MTLTHGAAAGGATMSARRIRVLIVGLLLGVALAALDGTVVAVAMPAIAGDLGNVAGISWVVTAYLLTATASTPLYGRVSDLYGRKPVFLTAVAVFLAGSAAAGSAANILELAAARGLQGLGGGGLMALALAVIADVVPARERGRYHGLFGAVFGLAGLVGPLLGGALVETASWRWIFYLNLPLGLLVLAMVTGSLRLPAVARRSRLDVRGGVLLFACLGAALLWLTRGEHGGFTAPGSWVAGLAAGVLAIWLVRWERASVDPILPPRLFADATFRITGAVAFVTGMVMFAVILFVPLHLQIVAGRSPSTAGLMLAAMTAGLLVTSVGSGRMIARTGRYKVFPVTGTALIAVAAPLLGALGPGTPGGLVAAELTLLGLGIGLISQVLVLAVQNAVDPADVGTATASVSFFRSLGGAVGTAAGGAVLAGMVADGPADNLPDGADLTAIGELGGSAPAAQQAIAAAVDAATHGVFVVLTPLAVLAFVLTVLLPELPLRRDTPRSPQPDRHEPEPS